MNIRAISGTGYVGLSNTVLLFQNMEVSALDIDTNKVNKINNRQSLNIDPDIEEYLNNKTLNLRATLNKEGAYKRGSDF